MQHNNATKFDKEFETLIKTIYRPGNYNVMDNAVSDLVMMTLKAIQNGNHPVIKRRNFDVDVLPVPNMTIFNQKTGHYTGVRFPANSSMALDLFSIDKNIDSRSFIPIEELKRMKLDNLVRYEDQINIVLKKHWTKDNVSHSGVPDKLISLRLVNMESLLKASGNNRNRLTGKDFDMYFPGFKNQITNYLSYTEKFMNLLQQNAKNTEGYTSAKKQITMDTGNSYLPELTAGMVQHIFCRITRHEYVPQFSREEHQKAVINLHRKNPELLKDAISQCGHIVDKSVNRLFGNDLSKKVSNSVNLPHNERTKNNTRKLSLRMT
jgi:hypothetical protein